MEAGPLTTSQVLRFLPTRIAKLGCFGSKCVPDGNDRSDKSVNFCTEIAHLYCVLWRVSMFAYVAIESEAAERLEKGAVAEMRV